MAGKDQSRFFAREDFFFFPPPPPPPSLSLRPKCPWRIPWTVLKDLRTALPALPPPPYVPSGRGGGCFPEAKKRGEDAPPPLAFAEVSTARPWTTIRLRHDLLPICARALAAASRRTPDLEGRLAPARGEDLERRRRARSRATDAGIDERVHRVVVVARVVVEQGHALDAGLQSEVEHVVEGAVAPAFPQLVFGGRVLRLADQEVRALDELRDGRVLLVRRTRPYRVQAWRRARGR